MAVVDKKWDGSASRFTDEQWARSCILDRADCSTDALKMSAKQRYGIPILEPNGDLNASALGYASGALDGARTPVKACPAAKKKAAKKLVAAYGRAKLDAPENIEALAGVSDSEQNGG